MKVEAVMMSSVRISEVPGLDPVHAIFQDLGPGKGRLIVECFGKAWACYWGAMGARDIRQFVRETSVDYLRSALSAEPRSTKRDNNYLERILRAVKDALGGLADGPPAPPPVPATVREACEDHIKIANTCRDEWP